MLKGKSIAAEKDDALDLKKGRWILDKLELVRALADEDMVTGSRIPYLGRKYYTEVFFNQQRIQAKIDFNQSKFCNHVNPTMDVQPEIWAALEAWHRRGAMEKTPWVMKLARRTDLPYQQMKFQKKELCWGNSSGCNNLPNPSVDASINGGRKP